MAGKYATGTDVPTSRSREEVERTLQRYGATSFGWQWHGEPNAGKPRVQIAFRLAGRDILLTVPMPHRGERRFTHHSRGERSQTAAEDAWEQACRATWRAIALLVKAKLEAVALGVSTVEQEFLAATVVPGEHGRTVYELIQEPLAAALAGEGLLAIGSKR